MYLNIINACVPFLYVKNIRYYKGKQILSYVLNEFLPILIYCILFCNDFNLVTFIVVWFFFWSFYEIGYLFNDVVSEKKEKKPSTRGTVDKYIFSNFILILVIRFSICIGIFSFILSKNIADIRRIIFLTTITGIIFTVHNYHTDYRFRLTSLIMLGVLRKIYIPYVIFFEIDALMLIILPSIIVKVINYVYAKHDLSWNLAQDRKSCCILYTTWFLFLICYKTNYGLTFFPIFLLQIFALIKHRKCQPNFPVL